MEASATPPPPRAQTAAPPPPPPAGAPKASGGWRALAVLLALVLAFACAVMAIAMVDIGDTPVGLAACQAQPGCTDYFDGTSAQKAIALVLGWASAGVAGLGVLAALAFTFTGRRGRMVVILTVTAIVLGAGSIVIGSV